MKLPDDELMYVCSKVLIFQSSKYLGVVLYTARSKAELDSSIKHGLSDGPPRFVDQYTFEQLGAGACHNLVESKHRHC
jgi:hypothetical protein